MTLSSHDYRPGTGSIDAKSPAMLEESADDLYEHAPCGFLSTTLDGTIAKVNTTLLEWLGYNRDELIGRRRFSDLLTVGGKLYHETHFAPLLHMQGEIGGIAFDLRAKDGTRLPVLVTSAVKTGDGGEPQLIRTTLFDARDRRAYEQELLRARQSAEHERDRLRQLVAELQRSLLPLELATPPGMQTSAYYHMASPDEVGGDFYDLFPLGGDRWGFFLGDVSGKGIEAAAVTALARYTLRAAAVYDPDPAAVLGNLNTVLYQEYLTGGTRYCTVLFGILEAGGDGGRRVSMVGGGHPYPLLLRADGRADYQPTAGGPIVGVVPVAAFEATTITLTAGDTLLLYTDGVTDARVDTADGRYGSEAFLEHVRALAPASALTIVAATAELLDGFGDGLDDDAAILALTIGAAGPTG
jgi:sigma-B regulation protein RsbU (phosphoserine phosphatase)